MEKIYNKPELMQSASSNIKTKLNLKVDIVEIYIVSLQDPQQLSSQCFTYRFALET